MKSLRFAVIGVGHLGRIHARLCHALRGVELVGVVDPARAGREAVAAELGVPAFATADPLLGQIDAAIVATPTRAHTPVGLDLVRHGVHLFVEKPLAASVEQASLLVAACRRQGVVLQVGHVERFNPVWQECRSFLHQPKYLDAVRVSGYPFRSTDIGVVLDLMIHDLDLALSVVDSPVAAVEALGLSVLGGHEDAAQARVTFQNGCVANFAASRVSYTARRCMQVWSAHAFATLDFAAGAATLVQPAARLKNGPLPVEDLSAAERAHLKEHFYGELLEKTERQAEPVNAIAEQQRQFAESIRTGQPPLVDGQQGRDAVALAEQILTRVAQHRWDGRDDGRAGPRAVPPQTLLPMPAPDPARQRRQAG